MSGDEPPFLVERERERVTGPLHQLAHALREIGYAAPAIGGLIQVDSIYGLDLFEFPFYRWRARTDSNLATATLVFLLEDPVSRERMEALLGRALVAELLSLGLLCATAAERLRSSVNLYPLDGLLFASDPTFFWAGLSRERPRGFEVYYVGRDSFDLAQATPRHAAGRALDLCTGTGVQAILAARHAEEVLGVDINPRAVAFAHLNATLNGITNVSFVESDLYVSVPRQSYDLITANPPFVAAPPGESTLFRDGGARGEDVLRRVLAGLPAHLAPGGRVYIVTHFVLRDGHEDAIAGSLSGAGFDVLLLDLGLYDERTLVFGQARPKLLGGGFDNYATEVKRWLEHTEAEGIKRLSYSLVALKRAGRFQLERRAVPPRPLGFPGPSPAQLIEKWEAT